MDLAIKNLNISCISLLLGIRFTLDQCKNPGETRITKLQGFTKSINMPLNHFYGKALISEIQLIRMLQKCLFFSFCPLPPLTMVLSACSRRSSIVAEQVADEKTSDQSQKLKSKQKVIHFWSISTNIFVLLDLVWFLRSSGLG